MAHLTCRGVCIYIYIAVSYREGVQGLMAADILRQDFAVSVYPLLASERILTGDCSGAGLLAIMLTVKRTASS